METAIGFPGSSTIPSRVLRIRTRRRWLGCGSDLPESDLSCASSLPCRHTTAHAGKSHTLQSRVDISSDVGFLSSLFLLFSFENVSPKLGPRWVFCQVRFAVQSRTSDSGV